MGRNRIDSTQKFWSKTDKRSDDECWEFLGSKDRDGYGQFWDGDIQKHSRAHIYSAKIHLGEKPSGMIVCHRCDNPICVNPKHLFYGSALDNSNDKISKNRHSKGESQGHSKLKEDQIQEIRSNKGSDYKQLCKKFSVAPSTIYRIWNNQSWNHI